jgi:hypothetical protein
MFLDEYPPFAKLKGAIGDAEAPGHSPALVNGSEAEDV